jgi:hypothetical protein
MVVDGRYATQLLARHWWETVFFNYRDSGFVQLHLGSQMKSANGAASRGLAPHPIERTVVHNACGSQGVGPALLTSVLGAFRVQPLAAEDAALFRPVGWALHTAPAAVKDMPGRLGRLTKRYRDCPRLIWPAPFGAKVIQIDGVLRGAPTGRQYKPGATPHKR